MQNFFYKITIYNHASIKLQIIHVLHYAIFLKHTMFKYIS